MALRKKKRKQIDDLILTATGLLVKEPVSTRKSDWVVYLVNAFINVLLVLGTLGCFLESISLEWNPLPVAVVVLSCAIGFSFFYKSAWLRFIGYIAVVVLFFAGVTRFTPYFMSGLAIVLNRFVEIFGQWFHVPMGDILVVVKSNSAEASVTIFLVVFSIFLTLFFNIVISHIKSYWIVLAFTFPFVQIPMYCQREIPVFYFLLYLVGVICLFCLRIGGHFFVVEQGGRNFSEFFKKEMVVYSYKASGRTNLAVLGFVSVTAFVAAIVISIVYPRSRFNSNEDFAWRQEIDNFVTNTLSKMSFNQAGSSAVGGIGVGKMGNVRFLKQDGFPDLLVYLEGETTEPLYLHAYRSSTYYDNSWLEDSVVTRMETQPGDRFVCLDREDKNFLGIEERKMYVENVGASAKYYYVPYWDSGSTTYFEEGTGSKFLMEQQKATISEVKEAVTKVQEKGSSSIWEDFFSWEEEYREGVYRSCLEVEDGQKERLLQLCQEHGICEGDSDLVEKVQVFLRENYKYTLSPGITPDGEDFVDYFLFNQKKGYCTYFASAAVLLYRSLGIPARYVTGYVVPCGDALVSSIVSGAAVGWQAEEVTQVIVSDKNAHAWVEVYVDGFGWYPVEVTTSEMAEEGQKQSSKSTAGILLSVGQRLLAAVAAVAAGCFVVVLFIQLLRQQKWKYGGAEVLPQMFSYLVTVTAIGGCKISRNLPMCNIAEQMESQYSLLGEELHRIVITVERYLYSSEQIPKVDIEQCKESIWSVIKVMKRDFSLSQRLRAVLLVRISKES